MADIQFPPKWVKVECPLPGFEGVTVEVNVYATQAQANAINASEGDSVDGIVRNIESWPYDADPWSKDVPMAWTAWLNRRSFSEAMEKYLADPNSSTA